jgi:hypothetical protein
MEKSKDSKKVAAGKARAEALSPERRKEIARDAVNSRWDKDKKIPKAVYTGTLSIGEMVFPCSVLSDGTRILTQTDFMEGMEMYYSGYLSTSEKLDDSPADLPPFLLYKALKPFVDKRFPDLRNISVRYRTEKGRIAHGVVADIIPVIFDVWIDADEAGGLTDRQKKISKKAKLLMRALAHTGIIALVDEVTGYQRDRASDALSQILEAFIAKELQPWIKTFPDDYYEQLFRLRGLNYPNGTVKRPSYFGYLTNDIIYMRLAPGVLDELRTTTPKLSSGKRKHHFHRKLTSTIGHPKLREHLSSVVTIMKLSSDYNDFKSKLDIIHPVYGETIPIEFGDDFSQSDFEGL